VRTAAPPDDNVDSLRVHRCVGNPPRQIEDPQSPPCVPYWTGDNGGDTSFGVTRDTITVYVPTEYDKKTSVFEPLKNFFNKRFEFYGRKLDFVYDSTSGIGSANPSTQQAAAQAARTAGSFASAFTDCDTGA
jgi:hypothetical protein